MSRQPPDWPKVLSLTVHEFRTPLTVVAGYLRMLATNRIGPLSESQKRVIDEAERSCAKMSALLTEVSDVAHFHQGRVSFLKSPVSLQEILTGIELTAAADARYRLVTDAGQASEAKIDGDAGRLRHAIAAIAAAVGRETLDSGEVYLVAKARPGDRPDVLIAIGSEEIARDIQQADLASLPEFDSARGGNGLSLIVARQIIEDHGGRLYGAPGDRARAGAAIVLALS